MKRLSIALCVLVLVAFASTSALADTFNFSFGDSGDAFFGSGVITGTSIGNGQFLIDNVTGTTTFTSRRGGTDVENITGVLDPGTFPLGIVQTPNDNVLYFPASYGFTNTYFDLGGLSYGLADGRNVNLFFNNGQFVGNSYDIGGFEFSIGSLHDASISVTSAASPVPEPSSLALLGTGVLGLAGFVRRRFAA